jgi:hypothetical protein
MNRDNSSYKAQPRLNLFPSDAPRSAYLYYCAIAVQLIASAVAGIGFTLNNGLYWLGGTLIFILWFVILFAIAMDNRKSDSFIAIKVRKSAIIIFYILVVCGIVSFFIFSVMASRIMNSGNSGTFVELVKQMDHNNQYNDGTALCHQATENFLNGRNPYKYANVVRAVQQFNGSFDRVTPLRSGQFANVFPYPGNDQLREIWNQAKANPSQPPIELESQVCYPAGSFLLMAPFVAMGIKDIRIIYLLFVLAGLAYAIWKVPGKYRFIFIAGALISLELWNSIADGETGAIIFPLLIVAWLSLKKNFWLSGIFMGLAVATKQTAWFMLPFYLILAGHYWGGKKIISNLGIIAAVFFALNGYFMAANLELWVQSVLSPMLKPMFPIGVGAVTLTTSGLFNIQSELPFTIMEAISGIICFLWYLKYHRKYPNAGIILGTVPLFFAWRSLWSYFFYIGLILLATVLTTENTEPQETVIVKQSM